MAAIAGMTGAQFDALPYEDGRQWELLSGELIEVPSPTPEHQDIVFNLLKALKQYGESRHDRLRPDVCVLLGDRANVDSRKVPIQGAPNIAVEVISPGERAGETRRKALTYLDAGVEEVWQVYPITREVLICYCLSSNRQ